MIPVQARAEPTDFDARVRGPGRSFLSTAPAPTARQWRNHDYWTRCLPELQEAYRHVCAYSCHWIPNTDGRSVEHFRPKSIHPTFAYEWTNYRFVFGVLNGCKSDREDILDPFSIEPGWFVIEFPTLLVKPAPGIEADRRDAIKKTCECLRLNDEDKCLKDRLFYVRAYCLRQVTFEFLSQVAPFLASELERQELRESIRLMMPFED